MKTIYLSVFFLLTTLIGSSTTWTITNSGSTFTPSSITITEGDSVLFSVAGSHIPREVSQTTWDANGTTLLAGGFNLPAGGGLVLPAQLEVGTNYYVCVPHAAGGMKGVIIVEACLKPSMPDPIAGNLTVCASIANTYSVVLDNSATSYTWVMPSGWTGNSTTNTITATPSGISGNLSVTANNACGSSPSQSISVTVNDIPSLSGTIDGETNICSGGSSSYSIIAASGATSYTWTLPAGWSGSSTTNSINVTSITSNGNISVTANNSCGSSVLAELSVTVSVNVPNTPGSISGITPVCEISSNIYTVDEVSGASSYTWTLPNGWTGSSTTASIPTVAGSAGGIIQVTANNVCGSSTAQEFNVTVSGGSALAQPGAISGNTTICEIGTNSYSIVAITGATSYSWTLPAGWSGSSTTNSINAVSTDTGGTISVTAHNNCGSSAAQTLMVNVTIVDTSVVQSVQSLTANATGATYQWLDCGNNTIISGEVSATFIAQAAGNYAVIVTQNNCADTSSCYNVTNVGLMEHQSDATLLVSPNPSNGNIMIRTDNFQTPNCVNIEIYDISGKSVYSKNSLNNLIACEMDLSFLNTGIYFIRVGDGLNFRTEKIVLE